MKIVKHKFNTNIKVVNLGDVHRGNPGCDIKFFNKTIKEIAEQENTYWVSTGDLLEVSIKHSIGDVHEAISVQAEMEALAEELLPIKNKCLGFVASNHHNRVNNHTGLNLDKTIANLVGIPYLGVTGIINIVLGNVSYFLCLHHGTGGGTVGNAINRAMKLSELYKGCDIYFSGHTHKMDSYPFLQQIVDRKRNLVRTLQSYLVITGHCMNWENSYAEKMALNPASIGFGCVELTYNGSGREICKKIHPYFITK